MVADVQNHCNWSLTNMTTRDVTRFGKQSLK